MKFVRKSSIKGVCIPESALKLSKLPDGENLELHTLDHALVLLKGQMTAPELLHVAHQLSSLSAQLLCYLSEVCGPCEDCDEDSCYYQGMTPKNIKPPSGSNGRLPKPRNCSLTSICQRTV